MTLKDKIVHSIIPYAMGVKDFDEKTFELELRNILKYYLSRKEFTATEIEKVLLQIDKNLDEAIKDIEVRKKMHNILRRVSNFARLYKNLSR